MKRLRGSAFDLFGYTAERKMERRLIDEYRSTVLSLLDTLSADKLDLAVEIAGLPEKIRGFGHVKGKAIAEFQAEHKRLLAGYAAGELFSQRGLGFSQCKINERP